MSGILNLDVVVFLPSFISILFSQTVFPRAYVGWLVVWFSWSGHQTRKRDFFHAVTAQVFRFAPLVFKLLPQPGTRANSNPTQRGDRFVSQKGTCTDGGEANHFSTSCADYSTLRHKVQSQNSDHER